jgi:hypothetical protein
MYVTLPLGFSTPLERCRALAATPLYMEGKWKSRQSWIKNMRNEKTNTTNLG